MMDKNCFVGNMHSLSYASKIVIFCRTLPERLLHCAMQIYQCVYQDLKAFSYHAISQKFTDNMSFSIWNSPCLCQRPKEVMILLK